MQTTN